MAMHCFALPESLERHRRYVGLSIEIVANGGPWTGRRVDLDGRPLFCERPLMNRAGAASLCGSRFGHWPEECSTMWDDGSYPTPEYD